MRHPDAWAQAIIELLAKPALRREMGKIGRQKALRFAWGRIAERIIQVQARAVSR
jgi:glycosyltransferase involved in cell wall biosynthesis